MKNKKSQAWSLDLIVAVIIFMFGMILLYLYAINYSSQSRNQLDELFYEGSLAAKLILSEEVFGILSDGKINQTKLEDFYNLSYETQKTTLGLNNDFYFTFTGLEINETPVDYVGKINNTETENLIQITRLTVYKNTPIKFNIFSWS